MARAAIGKLLFLYAAAVLATNAGGALLCEKDPVPSSCGSYTYSESGSSASITGCTGGTLGITRFTTATGCAPLGDNLGWGEIRAPANIMSSASDTGSHRYCYCQVRTVNGGVQ